MQIPEKLKKNFHKYIDTLPYKVKDYKIMFVGPNLPSGAEREEIIYGSEFPILLTFHFFEEDTKMWVLVGVKV